MCDMCSQYFLELKKGLFTIFKVFEEVRCPQMVVTSKNDCPNEKEGGLAERIWKWVYFTIFYKNYEEECK